MPTTAGWTVATCGTCPTMPYPRSTSSLPTSGTARLRDEQPPTTTGWSGTSGAPVPPTCSRSSRPAQSGRRARTLTRASGREAPSQFKLTLVGRRAVVAVRRGIALADRLAEADLRGALLERVALARVPRDPVEDRADHPAVRHALAHQRRVERELEHHELVHRHRGDPSEQHLRAPVELLGTRRLDRQSPLSGLGPRQTVTGEQQPLGALVTQAV